MRQNGEPSVEEILQSIKQVIARDNRAGARVERQRRATTGVQANALTDDEDDILELQDVAQVEPAREQDSSAADDDAELMVGIEPALLRAAARDSMRESLAALAMLSEPGVPPQIVRSGETSLEGLTRELLRPALAEWLDKNLPPMVERLVAAEIARIVGKKG